jgi:hypothetical protein
VRRLVPCLGLLVLLVQARGLGGEGAIELGMFPGAKIFPNFTADALAHGMALGPVTNNREWIGNIGASVPLVEVEEHGRIFQVGAAATVFNRIIKTPGHITVYTVDYKIDFPLDMRLQRFAFRLALGHVSSHFADDGIEILHQQSISYVRDYVSIAVSYDLPLLAGFAYAGGDWNYHFEPIAKPWILQAGAEGARLNVSDWAQVYAAFDVKIRQNLSWGTTQSYQAGLRFFVKKQYALRLAYTVRTGYEERGQFFDRRNTTYLLAVYVDF